jgi:hypothetical protein
MSSSSLLSREQFRASEVPADDISVLMHIVARRSRPTGSRAAHRLIGSALLVIAALLLDGCAASQPVTPPLPTAFQTDLDRYWLAVRDVCIRGVTPEMRSLYDAARQAVASTGYGAGTGSNFWGVRGPDSFYQDCFQSPGWE